MYHLSFSLKIVFLKLAIVTSTSQADLSTVSTLFGRNILTFIQTFVTISLPMVMVIGGSLQTTEVFHRWPTTWTNNLFHLTSLIAKEIAIHSLFKNHIGTFIYGADWGNMLESHSWKFVENVDDGRVISAINESNVVNRPLIFFIHQLQLSVVNMRRLRTCVPHLYVHDPNNCGDHKKSKYDKPNEFFFLNLLSLFGFWLVRVNQDRRLGSSVSKSARLLDLYSHICFLFLY